MHFVCFLDILTIRTENFTEAVKTKKAVSKKILHHASDILNSKNMLSEKNYIQHGNISCFEHSLNVAEKSIFICKFFSIKTNERALIRGALLHDYFLYDWHSAAQKLHGFFHAETALKNAKKDFSLCQIEEDIIKKHMFPLNITPPKHRESWIVCIADKICAVEETFLGLLLFFTNLV